MVDADFREYMEKTYASKLKAVEENHGILRSLIAGSVKDGTLSPIDLNMAIFTCYKQAVELRMLAQIGYDNGLLDDSSKANRLDLESFVKESEEKLMRVLEGLIVASSDTP